MTEKKFYTVQEAAEILNWSESGIKKLIYNDTVAAEKRDRKWYIDAESLEQVEEKLKGTWKIPTATSADKSSDTFSDTSSDKSDVTSSVTSADTSNVVATLLTEKDNQIEFLKSQLENAQLEKLELIRRQERSDIRKDVLLKTAIDNINIYKNLNENIIKSITHNERQAIEILHNKINIAIIEDDPDQAELIKLNLEKEEEDYSVYIFDNVTEPTSILKNFHLIILDLNLTKTDPITDAEKWIDILKQHNWKIPPIIIISGEEEERIEKAKLKINPVETFTKPIKIEELTKKLNALLTSQ